MQKTKLQKKTDTGVHFSTIPKFIVEHFGLRFGSELWWDIEGDRIVVYLQKPERSVNQVVENPHGEGKKEAVSEVRQ
jgi:hypothetical protein